MVLVANPYNSLPSLKLAHDTFHAVADKAEEGSDDLYGAFARLLIEHNIEDKVGIGLLHRHNHLCGDEIMLEINNVSTPVTGGFADELAKMTSSRIQADGWRISKDQELLEPYEFCLVPVGSSDEEVIDLSALTTFAKSFIETALKFRVDSVICLHRVPPQGLEKTVEISSGKFNLTVPAAQLSSSANESGAIDKSIQTAWYFQRDNGKDDNAIERKCHPNCGGWHCKLKPDTVNANVNTPPGAKCWKRHPVYERWCFDVRICSDKWHLNIPDEDGADTTVNASGGDSSSKENPTYDRRCVEVANRWHAQRPDENEAGDVIDSVEKSTSDNGPKENPIYERRCVYNIKTGWHLNKPDNAVGSGDGDSR